jgi:hypothetical protein
MTVTPPNCLAGETNAIRNDGESFPNLGNIPSVTQKAEDAADRINALLGRAREPDAEREKRMWRWRASRACSHCVVCEKPFEPGELVYREQRWNSLTTVCHGCRSKYREFHLPAPCENCYRPVRNILNNRSHTRIFCCHDCQVKARSRLMHERKIAERGTRECLTCSETFEPARADARFCSPACRQLAYRRRVTDRNSASGYGIPIRNDGNPDERKSA